MPRVTTRPAQHVLREPAGQLGAEEAADQRGRGEQRHRRPVHRRADREDHHRHGGDDQRQQALQRVQPDQPVVRAQRQRGDQDDAERAAEVAAVDGGQEHRRQQRASRSGAPGSGVPTHRLIRGCSASTTLASSTSTGTTASNTAPGRTSSSAQPTAEPAIPATEVSSIRRRCPRSSSRLADDLAQVAGPLGDRVGDVRGQRREPDGQQRREHQQRAAAGHRVDAAGEHPRQQQEHQRTRRGIDHECARYPGHATLKIAARLSGCPCSVLDEEAVVRRSSGSPARLGLLLAGLSRRGRLLEPGHAGRARRRRRDPDLDDTSPSRHPRRCPAPPPAAPCAGGWGSEAEDRSPSLGRAPLVAVRTGADECADRVEFELDGPAAGYAVSYVDQVIQDGSGAPLTVPGGARLQVQLQPPVPTTRPGQATYSGGSGEPLASVSGLPDAAVGRVRRQLRGILDVRGRRARPAAVPGVGRRRTEARSRLVLEVAHPWS